MTKIPNNDTFCILPWMHMQLDPSGAVQVCCASNYRNRHLVKTGDLNTSNPMEIWNNDVYKNLRQGMLAGKKNYEICGSCYDRDKTGITVTERVRFNAQYEHLGDLVNSTQDDGTLNTLKIRYLDLRFSNLCNLKCRTCGADWSTSIAAEQRKLRPEESITRYNESWKKIMPHLDELKELYFAGGEPLIMPEHYDFLDSLIEKKQTDLIILYNTNLTKLGIKNKNVIDYWRHFRHVGVAVSLDHYGHYANYVRGGSVWEEILANVKTIQAANVPSIDIGVSTVLSLYNVLHFGDFIIELFENNIISDINKLYIQQLVNPIDQQATNLTDKCLNIAIDNINNCIKYLENRNQNTETLLKIKKWLIDANNYNQPQFDRFVHYNKWLDSMRGTNFESTYPEFF